MGMSSGEIEICGHRYRIQAAPQGGEFADAVEAVRAPNTKERPRMAASVVVLEGMLSIEDFLTLIERLDDATDPLDSQALLQAAIELANRQHPTSTIW
jgi:hypothetical protein